MTASIVYIGNLRCGAEHVSLATCMLTTMAIKAGELQVDITDSKADVTKHMLSDPRRVGKVEVAVTLPANGTETDQKVLEKAGNNCPVMKSIHPDIELVINYKWG